MRSVTCLIFAGILAACARDSSAPMVLEPDDEPDDTARPDAGQPVPDAGVTPRDDAGTPPAGRNDAGGMGDSATCADCDDARVSASCDDLPEPSASVDLNGVTVSGVKVGAGGNTIEVSPGELIALSLDFTVSPATCVTGTVAVALSVGFVEGAVDCSGAVPCIGLGNGDPFNASLMAPSEPGTYGIYVHRLGNIDLASCDPLAASPDESTRIASVCVK